MKRFASALFFSLLLLSLTLGQSKLSGTGKVGGTAKVSVQVAAACSFACTAILDNFNRANEGPPPSASWTTAWRPSTTGFKVVSNVALIDNAANDNSTYWNTNLGPDVEVFAKIENGVADYHGLAARLVSEGTAGVDGYEVIQFGNVIGLYRWDDNTQSAAIGGTISQTFADGDYFGFKIIGSNFTIYRCAAGGDCTVGGTGWTSLGTRSDSTYSAAGKVGMRSGTGAFDDFGGGTR